MYVFIYQLVGWPSFTWEADKLGSLLTELRHRQGKLLGKMERLGFSLQTEASLQTLTLDVLKSSEIEGELLDAEQVRSSIARRLGIDIGGLLTADRNVEGVVEMMMDATQQYDLPLTEERLFGWHAALFPTGRSGMHKITVGAWRNNPPHDPMQVVSGPMGKETVHYEAPAAALLPDEMKALLQWFNTGTYMDPVLKAAIAHLWFVTIHPFDDGNGRMARAITDMQLSRADGTAHRFYSMSAQIRKERNEYYAVLEKTQRGDLDITAWLHWFLQCLGRAIDASEEILSVVLKKAAFWKEHEKTIFNLRQILLLNKLLDRFEGKLTTSKWARIAKCSHDTALRDITDLLEKKVLIKEEGGGRSTGYVLNK
ncbi:MAG: Fic family protein [Sphingobacteriales bacterium]|nr:Fic family protein [Sphingobacteriales bacterium]